MHTVHECMCVCTRCGTTQTLPSLSFCSSGFPQAKSTHNALLLCQRIQGPWKNVLSLCPFISSLILSLHFLKDCPLSPFYRFSFLCPDICFFWHYLPSSVNRRTYTDNCLKRFLKWGQNIFNIGPLYVRMSGCGEDFNTPHALYLNRITCSFKIFVCVIIKAVSVNVVEQTGLPKGLLGININSKHSSWRNSTKADTWRLYTYFSHFLW